MKNSAQRINTFLITTIFESVSLRRSPYHSIVVKTDEKELDANGLIGMLSSTEHIISVVRLNGVCENYLDACNIDDMTDDYLEAAGGKDE